MLSKDDVIRVGRYQRILPLCKDKIDLMDLVMLMPDRKKASICHDCKYLISIGYLKETREHIGIRSLLHYEATSLEFNVDDYKSLASRITEAKRKISQDKNAIIDAMKANPNSRHIQFDIKDSPIEQKVKQSQSLYSRERKSDRTWVSGSSLQSVFF